MHNKTDRRLETMRSYDGILTIGEMAQKLGISYEYVNMLCIKHKIPYKRRRAVPVNFTEKNSSSEFFQHDRYYANL